MSLKVALLCAPYASVDRPSLGLSILKSHTLASGHQADVKYLNIDFVEQFGFSEYQDIANGSPTELEGERYVARLANVDDCELSEEELEVKQWYQNTAAEVAAQDYDIYAFTCLFQQIRPSLLLAKLIKQNNSNATILFGGAALDYPMGEQLFDSFSEIDYLFMGESEQIFVQFLQHFEQKKTYVSPSILSRGEIKRTQASSAILADMNDSLAPDYQDFFCRFNDSILSMLITPFVFYESSRGCSWGQRSQCTFCGLNAGSIGYRSKEPAQVLEDISQLNQKYGDYINELAFVDNIIPENYYKSLLPELAYTDYGLTYFYEIKANVNFSKLERLKNANVMRIQPGIESLSTQILKCMSKGVTAIQNISLLVNAKRFGISVDWNILLNIPGEEVSSVTDMLAIIPALRHLNPPDASSPYRLDRHSPIFLQPQEYGIEGITPVPAYQEVYPELSEQAVFNLAYHFLFDDKRSEQRIGLHQDIQHEIELWKSGDYSLTHQQQEDGLLAIYDSRFQQEHSYCLTAEQSALYQSIVEAKDSISINKLPQFERQSLDDLVKKQLIFMESERVVALSVEA